MYHGTAYFLFEKNSIYNELTMPDELAANHASVVSS
jgi:hypothetical protein